MAAEQEMKSSHSDPRPAQQNHNRTMMGYMPILVLSRAEIFSVADTNRCNYRSSVLADVRTRCGISCTPESQNRFSLGYIPYVAASRRSESSLIMRRPIVLSNLWPSTRNANEEAVNDAHVRQSCII